MAVSLATPTFSEPVNPHPYSLGFLPLSEKKRLAKGKSTSGKPSYTEGGQTMFICWIGYWWIASPFSTTQTPTSSRIGYIQLKCCIAVFSIPWGTLVYVLFLVVAMH
jgi:hypothetical protein